ncbi:MAG: glycosyltransferase family 2 protein, partial [Vicinamibacterales bacterium]
MGEPKVTTIIPTYERPVLMKRAVLSVLGQSYSDFVVQILDNASTDDTASVARELMKVDSRVQYYRHKKNIGSLNNMIYGMQNVTTRYFNILCDDDVLLPEFMRDALLVHEQSNSRLAFVSTRVVAVNERGQFVDKMIHPKEVCILTPPEGIARCLKAGVSLTGVVYRTREISEIGAFRELWWNWTETGWHALAAVTSPIGFSPTIGGIFMDHVEGGSKRMGRVEFRLSWFKMFAEVYDKAQN